MILSDRSIREALAAGRIVVDPFDEACLQPSSIDVKVSHLFRVFRNHSTAIIDVKKELVDLTELVEMSNGEAFVLHPGEFVLGSTLERVAIANDLVARVEGKSSLGRLGLLIHSTAGFIDAGFDGHITLELSNVANLPITIYPGMKIGQVSFMTMTTPADKPYGSGARGSKYQGQRGPTPSRYFETSSEEFPSSARGAHERLFAGDGFAQRSTNGSSSAFTIFDCIKNVNGDIANFHG